MNILTSILANLAELSHLASVTSILCCCLLMVAFILRLLYQDVLDGNGSVARVYTQIPRVDIQTEEMPMAIKNITSSSSESKEEGLLKVEIQMKLKSDSDGVLFRAYWGVSVNTFHHVLKAPWPWFKEAFLHGNLFGASSCLALGELRTLKDNTDSSSNFSFEEQQPENTKLDLGPAPREVYPVVFCCLAQKESEDGNVGALLFVVHLRDEICRMPTHILAKYIKHIGTKPAATHLVPIYGTEESSDGESLCAVCQELSVSRVILPCKHACTCNRCFERLNGRCPMCRTHIQSFFVIRDEVVVEEEPQENVGQQQPNSWRQRLNNLNHRYAMAMGLHEN